MRSGPSPGFFIWALPGHVPHDDHHTSRQAVRMTDLQIFQRACRVFLARLLMVHGEDAPEVLRRMADELEWLAEAEAEGQANGRDKGLNG
jgi:hypothetical protein